MPVPRLMVYPIPIALGIIVTYQMGFAFEKPAWYRKGLADDYRRVSRTAQRRTAATRVWGWGRLTTDSALL